MASTITRIEAPFGCERKYPPHITPPPPPAWTVETRQDGSMLSCSLHQILTLPSECRSRNRDSSDQATFFQSSIVQFWWACANCCSLRFQLLEDRSGTRCGLLLHLFRDGILHILVVMSGWVTVAFLSSITSLSILLWHQQGIFGHTTAAHWIFSLFRTILCKPLRWLCMKIPVDQQFFKYSDQPVWHQQPYHVQSHLNPLSSSFWCSFWTSASRLHLIWMPKCIELLYVIGWLAIGVTKQLNRCT